MYVGQAGLTDYLLTVSGTFNLTRMPSCRYCPEFNGRLERDLRNPDGTLEIHIISFACDADFQNYRSDPPRTAQAWLLQKSSAKL